MNNLPFEATRQPSLGGTSGQRVYLTAREVQEGFLRNRGRAISRTTLDIWEGQGMKVLRRGGRKWYQWVEVWSWFETGRHCDLLSQIA